MEKSEEFIPNGKIFLCKHKAKGKEFEHLIPRWYDWRSDTGWLLFTVLQTISPAVCRWYLRSPSPWWSWWWFSCSVVSNSCDPMDCRPPGSSVHGVFQARILEWLVISFSRGFFSTRGLNPLFLHWQAVSCSASGFLTDELPGKSFHHQT